MSGFREDSAGALRALSRRPALVAAAVLTLATGIAGATAIFSVAEATVLRPLPFPEADRLAVIWQSDLEKSQPFVEISYPAFKHWRDENRTFEGLAGMPSVNGRLILTGRGEPTLLEGRLVTADFFTVLGVKPALGRTFTVEDDKAHSPRVIVLSDSLWRSHFGGDSSVVGQAVALDGHLHTIVGVMPPRFDYPRGAQLWSAFAPAASWALENPGVAWMIALGRLKPNVTLEAAKADMTLLWSRLHRPYFSTESFAAVVTPLPDAILGPSRPTFVGLLAAVGVVLLMACGNVGSLLMVRAIERRFEMTVRHALGASRGRLARMLVIECVVLASCAGGLGLLGALVGLPAIVSLLPQDVPRLQEVSIDGRTLGFAAGASSLAAILSGVAPVLLLCRGHLDSALRAGPSRQVPARSGVRRTIVMLQVAFAFVLVAMACLLVQSLVKLQRVPLGFEPERLLTVSVSPPERTYPEAAQMRGFFQKLVTRVRRLPGVEVAAAVLQRPLAGTVGMDWHFTVEGQSEADAARNPLLNLEAVTPDYFRTMGIPLKRGRDFTAYDREGQPGVVVVSESLARRNWPGLDPIGKRLKIPLPGTPYDDAWMTVIGVAGDARYRELQASRLDLYISYEQTNYRMQHLMVRTRSEPEAVIGAVRETVRSLDPDIPTHDAAAMSQTVTQALSGPRFATSLFGGFATIALLLAALGLYGLVAYALSRRTREIGIRMALGAQRFEVAWMVSKEILWLVVGGAVLGLLVSIATSSLIRKLLFGVEALDPATYGWALVVLICAAAAACLRAVYQATQVDPAAELRAE